jgi:hypothetical protein
MWRVAILPPGEKDPPVVGNRGTPVVILIETKPPRQAAFGLDKIKIGYLVFSPHAGNALETGGGAKYDLPIGQVAGIIIINAGVIGSDLTEVLPVHPHLEDLPSPRRAHRREKDLIPIEMQIHIPHENRLLGPVYRREFPPWPYWRHEGDLIVKSRLG